MLYISFRTRQDKVVFETWYNAFDKDLQSQLDRIIMNFHKLSHLTLRDSALQIMNMSVGEKK